MCITGGRERFAMNYPVVLHKDPQSDAGVVVPDLPGFFSAGRSVDEALAMANEAIELHLEGLIHDGKPKYVAAQHNHADDGRLQPRGRHRTTGRPG
jgi:predicted RNase H-like HicB family nuclease